MTDQFPTNGADDRKAVATYVASMSADMASMARHTGLETLGYLLEMVRLEAENASRHEAKSAR
jgi:hypothetical protein